MQQRRSSIAQKVLILLVVGGLSAGIIISLAEFSYSRSEVVSTIRAQNDRTMHRLEVSLSVPLWSLDVVAVARLLEAEMAREDLRAIVVTDRSGDFVLGRIRDGEGRLQSVGATAVAEEYPFDAAEFEQRSQPLTYAGSTIGEVRAYFTDEVIRSRLLDEVLRTIFTVGLLTSVLLAILWTLLTRMVVSPLSSLSRSVKRISVTKNFDLRTEIRTNDEIGALSGSVDQ